MKNRLTKRPVDTHHTSIELCGGRQERAEKERGQEVVAGLESGDWREGAVTVEQGSGVRGVRKADT